MHSKFAFSIAFSYIWMSVGGTPLAAMIIFAKCEVIRLLTVNTGYKYYSESRACCWMKDAPALQEDFVNWRSEMERASREHQSFLSTSRFSTSEKKKRKLFSLFSSLLWHWFTITVCLISSFVSLCQYSWVALHWSFRFKFADMRGKCLQTLSFRFWFSKASFKKTNNSFQ